MGSSTPRCPSLENQPDGVQCLGDPIGAWNIVFMGVIVTPHLIQGDLRIPPTSNVDKVVTIECRQNPVYIIIGFSMAFGHF